MRGLADAEDQQAEGGRVQRRAARSNRWAARLVSGRARKARARAIRPSGTLTANSHGQVPTDRMPAATVGPTAVDTATTRAL